MIATYQKPKKNEKYNRFNFALILLEVLSDNFSVA